MFTTRTSVMDDLEIDDLCKAHPIIALKIKDLEEECADLERDKKELYDEVATLEQQLADAYRQLENCQSR